MSLDRREFLIATAAAALSVAGGCATFRSGSELDSILEELDSMLSQIDGADNEALMAAAGKIGDDARALVDKHEKFGEEFNSMAKDRSVSDVDLRELAETYDVERQVLRNRLLADQDELHAALPDDLWPDILEVMNRKSRLLVPQRGLEG